MKYQIQFIDCRIPGKLYKGKQNKTKGGIVCKKWAKATENQREYGAMIHAQDNYCTNLYTDEPVCFPGNNQSDVTSCGVPICSKFIYVSHTNA
jgi:hypothetical protein